MADTHIVVAPCRIYGVDYVGGERVDASTWPVPVRDLLGGSLLIQEISAATPSPAAVATPAVPPAPAPMDDGTPPPPPPAVGGAPKPRGRRR
jgi:hypothetical protein